MSESSFLALLAFLAFLTFLFSIIGGFFILFWFRRNRSPPNVLQLHQFSPILVAPSNTQSAPILRAPPSDQRILQRLRHTCKCDVCIDQKLLLLSFIQEKIHRLERDLQRLFEREVIDDQAYTNIDVQLRLLYAERRAINETFF
jgi:hypothetical protein